MDSFKLISHRGNTEGPRPKRENTVVHILDALEKGYDCEIDVWYVNKRWWLGHDKPQYLIPFNFLQMPGLWCHCKNVEALHGLLKHPNIISVWIDVDSFPLTSNGYIWTHTDVSYPDYLTSKSIAIQPEEAQEIQWDPYFDAYKYCAGVCSDYVSKYVRSG